MRTSKVTHSVSSVSSSRTYPSERTRHRSCSSKSSNASRKKTRTVKFVIAIGIALPIVAAIIGVVAWAVSADTAFEGPVANSLRRSDAYPGNPDEDIFQALEDRHDVEYSRHFGEELNQDVDKHFARLDNEENHNQFDDNPSKDPLYIVHFVPTPKPSVESSTSGSNVASTVSNEVIQKILSASKGAKPGTPQFVVFAPIPGEEGNNNDIGTLEIGSQGLEPMQNQLPSNNLLPDPAIDYDYEEELRKYQELLDSTDNPPDKETSRVGESKRLSKSKTEIHKKSKITHNETTGGDYKPHLSPEALQELLRVSQKQLYEQQQAILAQQNLHSPSHANTGVQQVFSKQPTHQVQNYQQSIQDQSYQQRTPQGQSYLQQPVQQDQTYYQPSAQQSPTHHQHQPVEQVQAYQQSQQQYYPEQSQTQQVYQPQPQPLATDRSGQYEPIGIKFNIGGGNGRGLLGGSLSPIGIIGSILKPLLPRLPQVNLNGKVMFGVMLEKGVKLGDKGNTYG